MKPLQIVVCALTLGLATAVHAAGPSPEVQQQIQQLVTEGQAAYQKGDIPAAKTAFQQVYELDSRNTTAIGYLRRIQIDEKSKPKYVPMERQLAGLVIPQIQFKEATLGSALDYLKKAADRQSNGKIGVNFVVQLPPEKVNTQQVTLNLSNVPFSEALKYLGTVASLDFVYDKYAIIVKPKVDASPTASTSPTAPTAPTVPGLPGSQ
jgi:hypothetical protein